MLHVDGDISLTAAVNLAARSGDMDPVGHATVFELVNELIHHGLDYARRIGTGYVTVQPALFVQVGDSVNHGTKNLWQVVGNPAGLVAERLDLVLKRLGLVLKSLAWILLSYFGLLPLQRDPIFCYGLI